MKYLNKIQQADLNKVSIHIGEAEVSLVEQGGETLIRTVAPNCTTMCRVKAPIHRVIVSGKENIFEHNRTQDVEKNIVNTSLENIQKREML